MSDGNRDPAAKNAESGTKIVPTFSLNELNRYKGKLLGGGAFGKVYAINGFPSLAVKEIYLSGQQDRLVEITKFELEALSKFSHPGVLKYHQVLTNGDFVYIIMDRYDGDLNKLIDTHRMAREPIPRELLLSIMRQLADALAYVHAPYKVNKKGDVLPGIVHRDLKPANILMSRDGERVAIADFGLCKDAQHNGNTLAGTLLYMAPEVFIHRKTSRASDIWALGVIIYELATLDLPSFSCNWKPEDAKEFFVPKWKPNLNAIEDEFTRTILEKIFVLDPEERPTARELANRLRTLSISANELGTRDPLLAERHKLQVASDSGTLKAKSSWMPLMRAAAAGDTKAVKKHLSKKDKKNNRKDMALIFAARAGHADIVELLDPTDWNGVTALMRAAERGDVEAVRALIPLQKGKKVARDTYINGEWIPEGRTALMMAAARGHVEVVRLLAEHEGGMKDDFSRTALIHAAEKGHAHCVELLAEKEGCMQDCNGWTTLMHAAENDYTDCAKLLLEKEACMQNKNGLTALMSAARNNRTDCVKLLLEKEVGMQDNDGWTALMYAACNGRVECVELLLHKESGMHNDKGQTALVLGAQRRHDEVVKLLMEQEGSISGWTRLIYSAYLGDVDAVKSILHKKGCKDITGMTALMWAAYQGHKEAVEILLEHEKGMRDDQDHNALYHALKSGHMEVAEIVIPHEDPTDENGVTALMRAAARGDAEMVELLIPIQKGKKANGVVNINGYNIRGGTALMVAATYGHAEVIKLLLDHESGMKDKYGWTALMWAARNGHLECVELLLEKEAGMQNSKGWTALMFAVYWKKSECVRLLLEKERGQKNKHGQTAFILAAQNGKDETMQLLMKHENDVSGWTGLISAAYFGDVDAARGNLHEKGQKDANGRTALIWAAENNHIACVKLLLDKEDRMQANDNTTALMRAAYRGHTECVRLLVEKEYGMQDSNGWTALMFAAYRNNIKCVRLLKEKEKDLKTTCELFWYPPGSTALDIAKMMDYTEIVSILRE